MKKLTNALLIGASIWIFFILQSTLMQGISIGGITPNLMLILTVAYGLLAGDYTGIAAGFFSGLFCDLFFGSYIGFYAMILALIGFICGKSGQIMYIEDLKFPLAITAFCNILYAVYCYIFQFLFRGRMVFGHFMIHYAIPETIYTLILTLPLFLFLRYIYNRFMKEVPQSFIDAGKGH